MARAHTPPAWRRRFLRELARSASVELAARKVGIDRSSAYQVRKRNPAFALSWDRAVEWGREQLIAAGAPTGVPHPCSESRASEHPLPRGGGETRADIGAGGASARPTLRLRDDEVVRASKSGKPCILRAGPGRWSVGAERAFLEELVATANVKAAARAAGVSAVAAYNRRRQWPAFAAAWDAALAEGWGRLEMLLVCAATATLDPEPDIVETREPPAMSVDQAMKLWLAHRASVQGGKPQRYGWRRQEPDIETVRAEILRKVSAIRRARGGGGDGG